MELFNDGYDVEKHASASHITGFTTNCSIIASSPTPSYTELYARIRPYIGDKCFSLQIWKDNPTEAIQQVDSICAIDSRIFVKIPVVNTSGVFNDIVIQYCVSKSIPMNLTAIHTIEQIDMCRQLLSPNSVAIVSVFAGPISDKGIDPNIYIQHAKRAFADCPHVRILWAGCREIYTIERARQAGADIITIPDAVIDRMKDMNKSLETITLERVRKFFRDAESCVKI
jgi:transaldolase